MTRLSRPREDAAETDDDLFAWGSRQPQAEATAALVDFRKWREGSARYQAVIRPRNASVEFIAMRLDRRLGLVPSAPVFAFPNPSPPRRRA